MILRLKIFFYDVYTSLILTNLPVLIKLLIIPIYMGCFNDIMFRVATSQNLCCICNLHMCMPPIVNYRETSSILRCTVAALSCNQARHRAAVSHPSSILFDRFITGNISIFKSFMQRGS